jgi:hypothetical protein
MVKGKSLFQFMLFKSRISHEIAQNSKQPKFTEQEYKDFKKRKLQADETITN